MADPATYLDLNSVPGPYFPENSLFILLVNHIFEMYYYLADIVNLKFWLYIILQNYIVLH